jgi:hypothetical protein
MARKRTDRQYPVARGIFLDRERHLHFLEAIVRLPNLYRTLCRFNI